MFQKKRVQSLHLAKDQDPSPKVEVGLGQELNAPGLVQEGEEEDQGLDPTEDLDQGTDHHGGRGHHQEGVALVQGK